LSRKGIFMRDQCASWSRRQFVGGLTLAGTAALLGLRPEEAAAEPPPETPRLRLYKFPGICLAPQYVAEGLLRAEGFTDLQYLEFPEGAKGVYDRVGSGAVDLTQWYLAPFIVAADKKAPIVFLSGVHISFVVAMLGHVGLDYRKDVNFVEKAPTEAVQLLAEGKVDAFLAAPPLVQELRAKKIGHVIVNMATDRPWSQYFCCMLVGNRDFVRKHPVATKRAVRAILKADQICALEPERVARDIVDGGFTKSYDYALQTMKDVPYGRWRQYDPEDAVRFYALRLHEAGLIESTPPKMIAEYTDWRFLNALKKELKG
jgi:NitT/TauT family transport system substrate-binding protein